MTTAAAAPDRLAADRRERLAGLLEATSPATRAREAEAAVLPVLAPLAGLLPHGGLAKGTVTEATDTSLLLALAAGPATADRYAWTAAVGLPDLGLAAAAGYGLDLRRLLVVDHPGEHAVEVITALAAACPVVLAAAPTGLPPRTLDRLAAHLRRTGTVLLTPGPWSGAQLRLQVTAGRWAGLGDGWGKLTGRQVKVAVTGRGSAVRARSAELWLPDRAGAVSPAGPGLAEVGGSGSAAVAALG
ncbi:hypothetical protein OG196_42815 [Kitasatospora purpeofusca]|uniref:hypothetical protein n=1 Tax=Kitasatospora purpeofusca TaxID=67352 RepID=UPI002E1440FB|nr:hypothetical protein OG196_00110 [Kitasatospora purpeofusca]WSR45238.1 hypothetical protein OG196_42815 [Kitasatospora purpeofusca]